MIIYLIGMPGSGKTTIAKALAAKLNYKYIDLDRLIEKNTLMFTDEIIETMGESFFREQETNALKSINNDTSNKNINTIVSTGGGIVTKKENKQLMNGLKIYIDTKIEIIETRIKGDQSRPLLKTKTLDTIYEERFLKYQDFADIVFSNNKDIDTTVVNIINYLKDKEGLKWKLK